MAETIENKTTKLIVSDLESESTKNSAPGQSNSPQQSKDSTPRFARISGVDFADRAHAEAVIKDLPMDEFLRVVEGASSEELQSMLTCADLSQRKRVSSHNLFGALFDSLDYKSSSVLKILGWWESRRFFYNVIVSLCGLFTLVLTSALFPNTFGGALWALAIPVGIVANVCYTLGWICDAYARGCFKEKAEHFGPILFSLGLILSIIVVLSPIVMMCFAVVIQSL